MAESWPRQSGSSMLTPSEYRCPTKVGARALLKLFEAPGRFAGKSLNYVRVRAVLITGLWPNDCPKDDFDAPGRSEEHTSELQSLMRISYAVFCLKKKKKKNTTQ